MIGSLDFVSMYPETPGSSISFEPEHLHTVIRPRMYALECRMGEHTKAFLYDTGANNSRLFQPTIEADSMEELRIKALAMGYSIAEEPNNQCPDRQNIISMMVPTYDVEKIV